MPCMPEPGFFAFEKPFNIFAVNKWNKDGNQD
jgi:hypothetical protein